MNTIKVGVYNVVVKKMIPKEPQQNGKLPELEEKKILAAQLAVFVNGAGAVVGLAGHPTVTLWPHVGMFFDSQVDNRTMEVVDLNGQKVWPEGQIEIPGKEVIENINRTARISAELNKKIQEDTINKINDISREKPVVDEKQEPPKA